MKIVTYRIQFYYFNIYGFQIFSLVLKEVTGEPLVLVYGNKHICLLGHHVARSYSDWTRSPLPARAKYFPSRSCLNKL